MRAATQRIPGEKGKRINAARQKIRVQIKRYRGLMDRVNELDMRKNELLVALGPKERLVSTARGMTAQVAVKNINLVLVANPDADSGLELDIANVNFVEKLTHNMDVLGKREAEFGDLRKGLGEFLCKEREIVESHLNTLKLLDEKVLSGKRDYIGKIKIAAAVVGAALVLVPKMLLKPEIVPQTMNGLVNWGVLIGSAILAGLALYAFNRKLERAGHSVLEGGIAEVGIPTKKETLNEIESGKIDVLANMLFEKLEDKIKRQKEGLFKRAEDAIQHGTNRVGEWIAQLERAF